MGKDDFSNQEEWWDDEELDEETLAELFLGDEVFLVPQDWEDDFGGEMVNHEHE